MTWKEAWKRGAQSLQKAGVEEYDLDAWYLLEHVTEESLGENKCTQEECAL